MNECLGVIESSTASCHFWALFLQGKKGQTVSRSALVPLFPPIDYSGSGGGIFFNDKAQSRRPGAEPGFRVLEGFRVMEGQPPACLVGQSDLKWKAKTYTFPQKKREQEQG